MALTHDEFISAMESMDDAAQSTRSLGVPMVLVHMVSLVRTAKEILAAAVESGTIDKEEHKELTAMAMRWMSPLPRKTRWEKFRENVRDYAEVAVDLLVPQAWRR